MGARVEDVMNKIADEAENVPITTATRVPSDEFECDDEAADAPIATATRVP